MEDRAADRRIVADLGVPDIVDRLADLPGSDLTNLLLQVMRTRSRAVTAPDALRRFADDRFVRSAEIGFQELRRAEDAFLAAIDDPWTLVQLSPLVPFAAHAAMGDLSQDRVVSTIRGNEVAADPTNGLSLEIAVRRRRERTATTRLATIQRVVRAQRFEQAPSHFTIFALASAGRDAGNKRFELQALSEHVSIHVAALRSAGCRSIRVLLTDLTEHGDAPWIDSVRAALEGTPDTTVDIDDQREGGRAYYDDVCFKIRADFGNGEFEASDGGFTMWMASLLQDKKERLCISGSGLERVAARVGAIE